MKKIVLSTIIFVTLLFTPPVTFAQGMMGNLGSSPSSAISDDHTAREEAEGKEIWEKLREKKLECNYLSDEQFGSLGEYFMGQSIDDTQRHALMNQMMTNMAGEEGEEQIHIVMGKRVSGCDTTASLPQNGVGFMPMMLNMMMGGGNPMMGYGRWNNMMDGWGSAGWPIGFLGWLPMLFFWILLILGVVALIRHLGGSTGRNGNKKSPLDILKERYAKGEIDKKEFEKMKKDVI